MDNALWTLGRASGMIALALFTLTVVLGILTGSGRVLPGLPRFSVVLLHRNISLLATVFLGLHVGTLLLDSYAKLTLFDLVVPFMGSYRPFWQGLGTVALDLVLAVILTGLLRRRLGLRAFRAIHWFSYAMWPIALAHGIGNGAEGRDTWFLVLAAASVAVAGGAALWRVSAGFTETAKVRQGGIS